MSKMRRSLATASLILLAILGWAAQAEFSFARPLQRPQQGWILDFRVQPAAWVLGAVERRPELSNVVRRADGAPDL